MLVTFGANRPMIFGKTPPSRSSTSTVYQYSSPPTKQDIFISQPHFGVIGKRKARKYAEDSKRRQQIHAQNNRAREKMNDQLAYLRSHANTNPLEIQAVRSKETIKDKQNRAERDLLYDRLSRAHQIEYNLRFKLKNKIKETEQAPAQQTEQRNFFPDNQMLPSTLANYGPSHHATDQNFYFQPSFPQFPAHSSYNNSHNPFHQQSQPTHHQQLHPQYQPYLQQQQDSNWWSEWPF